MAETKSLLNHDPRQPTFSVQFVAGSRRYSIAVMAGHDGKRYLRINENAATGLKHQNHGVNVPQEYIRQFLNELSGAAEWCDPKALQTKIESIRERYPRAYQPWTPEDDDELAERYSPEITLRELATMFQRQPGAISSRLRKLGLASS
jgi:hypothetical protein